MNHPSALRRLAVGVLSLSLSTTVFSAVTLTAAEAAEAPTTRVWITKHRNVKMPSQLRPGVHRFAVRSAKSSGFQIIKPRAGYTKREIARDVAKMWEDVAVMKRFERNVSLIGGVSSRPGEPGFMWARLPAGRYWVVDTMPEQILPRKIKDLQVGGARLRGVLPGRATLQAVNDADFAATPKAIPGSGRLVLRNNSTSNHFFGMAKLRDGKTLADFDEWVENAMEGNETRAPVAWNTGLETGVVGPDRAMSLVYDLPPGKYVLMCWWPDTDMDNMPHVFMGMYREVTVR